MEAIAQKELSIFEKLGNKIQAGANKVVEVLASIKDNLNTQEWSVMALIAGAGVAAMVGQSGVAADTVMMTSLLSAPLFAMAYSKMHASAEDAVYILNILASTIAYLGFTGSISETMQAGQMIQNFVASGIDLETAKSLVDVYISSDFVSGVSPDFQTVLTTVEGAMSEVDVDMNNLQGLKDTLEGLMKTDSVAQTVSNTIK